MIPFFFFQVIMLKKKLFQLVVGSLVPPKSSVKCGVANEFENYKRN
jgi:hypothetical protein